MMEAAVVVGLDGSPLHYHSPPGRTSVALPDARDLWDVIWEHRAILAGVAHSHPGSGLPGPSREDVTTFSAIEDALGRRLEWWIISSDRAVVLRWMGPEPLRYRGQEVLLVPETCRWLSELHRLSYENPRVPAEPTALTISPAQR